MSRGRRAEAVHLEVEQIDGAERVSVLDDGVSGADPGRGSGLVGLSTGSRTLAG
jgi:hypothetical protein